MSRIKAVLNTLKDNKRKALIPYITGGDPKPEWTVDLMHTLVRSGADLIELGVPFSDPMADGPVIQLACERALEHGTSLLDILAMVKAFRETDTQTPVVLMGYLNPVERMGYDNFAKRAADAGVDGVLLVDLPPEEAGAMVPHLKQYELDAVFLIAPTTTDDRIRHICEHSSGYVYYVSVKGVTGSASLDEKEIAEKVARIQAHNQIPVGVGFGIRDAASAKQIAALADGVIVGSALVNRIADNRDSLNAIQASLSELLGSMRAAIDELD